MEAQVETQSATTDLDRVIGETPAAVLVVDLAAGMIVHANDVADQLAPQLRLPVRLDAWSEAAGLLDPAGRPLTDTDHPLSRVLRAEAVSGQPVSARRRSEMGLSREPLWMIGVPMTGAPMLEQHALVVLLPVREQDMTAAVEAMAHEAQLHEKAVLATGLSFTVADARSPELPLVWVNPAFTATTGYEFGESVGHNCRFLQGPGTDPAEVARIRDALVAGEGVVSTVLNYRKDGLAFWNQVTITPVFDAAGDVTHFVGVQSDVSGRIESDRQRDRALDAERLARLDAELAQARLTVMAEVSEAVSGEVTETGARVRLLESLVERWCDAALLVHLDADGTVGEHHARHRDAALAAVAEEVAAGLGTSEPPGALLERVLGDGSSRLVNDEPETAYARHALSALGLTSALAVELPGPSAARDLLVLGRGREAPAFTEADAELVVDLGRRVGVILDNVRMYAHQSHIAQALQRSLLPSVPALEAVDVDARYLPGARDAEVGGDFYDVFEHADHSIGLAVGDVEGHDVHAAAAMGQLRGLLRATALTQRLMPAATLEHIDWLLAGTPSAAPGRAPSEQPTPRLASMVFVHLEPPALVPLGVGGRGQDVDELAEEVSSRQVGDWPRQQPAEVSPAPGWSSTMGSAWTVTLSSAGHLPPLARLPEGRLVFLDPPHARGPLLGVGAGAGAQRRHDGTFALPSGSVLLLYTDGLVERPGEPIDAGLGRLLEAASSAPADPAAFVDHLLAQLLPQPGTPRHAGTDDVVVVAMHLLDRKELPESVSK